MARLYLFAEGQTEHTFAHDVIGPYLAGFQVFLHRPVLIAHARKRGATHRGGGRKYLPRRNDILRFTAQEKASDVFFTTMIDLYAIHSDFPGLAEAEKLQNDPYKRVQLLESAWIDDIGDRHFIPHIQLHEFETYLFVDPSKFELFYDDIPKGIDNLQAIADAYASPELIDDGQQTAPSKRIIGQFFDYKGAKPAVGPQLCERIGLGAIRDRCPHFDQWLKALESLG